MAELAISRRNWIHDLADYYDDQVFSRSNPDVMRWPLVGQDWPCFAIIFSYAFFINYFGPTFMKNRKPFDLRWLMVPYNIILVIFNFYIFFEYAKIRIYGKNELKCETTGTPINAVADPETYRLAEISWYFYMTKYAELFDTVFFVLRKKDRQLSRLHKVHHTTVPLLVLLMLRAGAGGYNSFFPLANSFVHTIMYTYYAISALGDEVTIHLRFKRYVTMCQMIQFVLVIYYFVSRPFYGCNWVFVQGAANLFIAGSFFILFLNFYWHEYCISQTEMKQNGVEKNKKV